MNRRSFVATAGAWASGLLGIGALHAQLNRGGVRALFQPAPRDRLVVGHLPVTCHLTCPVTSWVSTHSERGSVFQSRRFTSWSAVTEAFQAGELSAAFILAPLAMTMRRRGVPVKIVYLGHRDGTTLIVKRDGPVQTFADLRGKKIAVPHRYSNQRILIARLIDRFQMREGEVELLDFPPPEMPAGLRSNSFDAYITGEPFGARAELDGFGRVLYFTKDVWPNFISCVLCVRQDLIDHRRALVQELVDGIASSGFWLDAPGEDLAPGVRAAGAGARPDPSAVDLPADWPRTHRAQAALIASRREMLGQSPELLRYVLSRPPDRVRYVELSPARTDFEEIQRYAERLHFFEPASAARPFGFEDYCDPTFAAEAARHHRGTSVRLGAGA